MNTLPKCRVFQISKARGTKTTRASEMPNILASKTDLLSIAKQSLEASRQAVEKLLDSIHLDDHYSVGILGPILERLRESERDIVNI